MCIIKRLVHCNCNPLSRPPYKGREMVRTRTSVSAGDPFTKPVFLDVCLLGTLLLWLMYWVLGWNAYIGHRGLLPPWTPLPIQGLCLSWGLPPAPLCVQPNAYLDWDLFFVLQASTKQHTINLSIAIGIEGSHNYSNQPAATIQSSVVRKEYDESNIWSPFYSRRYHRFE